MQPRRIQIKRGKKDAKKNYNNNNNKRIKNQQWREFRNTLLLKREENEPDEAAGLTLKSQNPASNDTKVKKEAIVLTDEMWGSESNGVNFGHILFPKNLLLQKKTLGRCKTEILF